jgi:DNA-binding CsgD family transcriptional regulator
VHDDDHDGEDLTRLRLILIPILIAVAVLGALDLASDRPTTWRSAHVLLELSLIAVSAGGALALGFGWRRTAGSLASAREALVAERAEAAAWRAKAEASVKGFRAAIYEQFAAWQLTPAEQEVAILILQGHGHKQIAFATQRSERTVRQHAVAVYQKSGLGGRAELAAFFLAGLR